MAKQKNTVIIVDDSDSQRKALSGLLELRGYHCVDTDRGDDIVRLLEKHTATVKACAIDLSLGANRLSGLETLRAIRRRQPILPVLVFTGHDEDKAQDAFLAGATLFMRKPYQTQDLMAAIDSLVLMHSLRQSKLATDGEIEMLQAVLDAMNVEVTVCKSDSVIELENSARKHWTSRETKTQVEDSPPNGIWIESTEGNRTVWSNKSIARSKTGREFIVTTAIDVTKRKLLDEFRQKLFTVVRTSTREELVEFVATWLHERFGYARVRVYLGTVETMAGFTSRGMPSDFVMRGRPFPIRDPQARRALGERRPFLLTLDDFKNDPCFEELDKTGVTTQIQIPLVSAAGLVGLISADDKKSRYHLNIEDIELMSHLSALFADALQFVLELRASNRREEWATALNDIDCPLTDGSGLPVVFRIMGKTLAKMVQADAGVVFVRNNQFDILKAVCVIDDGDDDLRNVTHSRQTGMCNTCLETGKMVFVRDVWSDLSFREYYDTLDNDIWKRFLKYAKSVVVEPIFCGDKVIGVLFLRCNVEINLDEIDERYLGAVAKRVSIALAKLDESQRIEAALIQQAKLHDLALLSAGVAHGMRNPLATIQASLDLVRRQCDKDYLDVPRTDVLEAIRTIENATQRSLKTLELLIEWARPHGTLSQTLKLGPIIEDLVAIIREDLEFRQISVNTSIAPSLPLINGPPDALRMALSDLFWNAAKAMPNGGTLSVSLNATLDTRYVNFEITDTGVGMSQETLEGLFSFSPFEPLPAGGSGLGLYLCRKVLAAAGAELRARSVEGKGTSMTAVFPIAVSPYEG